MTNFKIGQQVLIKDSTFLPYVSQVGWYRNGKTATVIDEFYGIVVIKLNEQPPFTKVSEIGLWKDELNAIEVIENDIL